MLDYRERGEGKEIRHIYGTPTNIIGLKKNVHLCGIAVWVCVPVRSVTHITGCTVAPTTHTHTAVQVMQEIPAKVHLTTPEPFVITSTLAPFESSELSRSNDMHHYFISQNLTVHVCPVRKVCHK